MSASELRYAVVTPARDDVDGVRRLAACLSAQTVRPQAWVVVENGSTDDTAEVASSLAEQHSWIRVVRVPAASAPTRAKPIVAAFMDGLAQLDAPPDVVLKIDADVSFEPDHIPSLLREFTTDPRLGVASGSAYEQDADGIWRERHGTGPGVWGACRAYRWACLQDVLPLEQRMGWDTIDLITAEVRGWNARLFSGAPFYHHRAEGVRDGGAFRRWRAQGHASHYMGYRFSYLLARSAFRMARQPAALGILVGFVEASLRREPRHRDPSVLAWLRGEQRLRKLPVRMQEALRSRRRLDSRPTHP
jgi:biofilm PGA synthesis N-glycosyltransferase PgaC